MDNEQQFLAMIWKCVITGVVVVWLAGIGSCQATRYNIRASIEAGASPVAASCAIHGSVSNSCTMIAAAEAEAIRP